MFKMTLRDHMILCVDHNLSRINDVISFAGRLNVQRIALLGTKVDAFTSRLVDDLKPRGGDLIVRVVADNANPALLSKLRTKTNGTSRITSDGSVPTPTKLVERGEFRGQEDILIITDATPIGLLCVMKALGEDYPEVDQDCAIFMTGKDMKVDKLQHLTRMMYESYRLERDDYDLHRDTVKDCTDKIRKILDMTKGTFNAFINSFSHNDDSVAEPARAWLTTRSNTYRTRCDNTKKILSGMTEVAHGVYGVDTTGVRNYNRAYVHDSLRKIPEGRITVIRQLNESREPVYSIRSFERDGVQAYNLETLLPTSRKNHEIEVKTVDNIVVSQNVWENNVRPALVERFRTTTTTEQTTKPSERATF